jgi:hypothetical protein
VTLTAKVDLMLTSLQMEFVLHPDTRVLHLPRSAAAEPGEPAAPGDQARAGSTVVVSAHPKA